MFYNRHIVRLFHVSGNEVEVLLMLRKKISSPIKDGGLIHEVCIVVNIYRFKLCMVSFFFLICLGERLLPPNLFSPWVFCVFAPWIKKRKEIPNNIISIATISLFGHSRAYLGLNNWVGLLVLKSALNFNFVDKGPEPAHRALRPPVSSPSPSSPAALPTETGKGWMSAEDIQLREEGSFFRREKESGGAEREDNQPPPQELYLSTSSSK